MDSERSSIVGASSRSEDEYSVNRQRSNYADSNGNTRESDERDQEEAEGDGEEEEEEEEITPAELIEKLQQSWLNEKFAPELLEHKTPVVECIIEQIKHMENNIKSAKKGDFRIAIHKLELDRIKFMLYSYLRIRIKKIEQFAYSILDEDGKRSPNTRSKLSPEEYAYAIKYLKNVKSHLTASVLEHLPANLQELNENVTMPKADLDKFIFLKSTDHLQGVMVDDLATDGRSEILDMERNDLYVMRYRSVRDYVNSDQIQLI